MFCNTPTCTRHGKEFSNTEGKCPICKQRGVDYFDIAHSRRSGSPGIPNQPSQRYGSGARPYRSMRSSGNNVSSSGNLHSQQMGVQNHNGREFQPGLNVEARRRGREEDRLEFRRRHRENTLQHKRKQILEKKEQYQQAIALPALQLNKQILDFELPAELQAMVKFKEMLGGVKKKITEHYKHTQQLFQQSPINAGGYNPRTMHGFLGATHLLKKNDNLNYPRGGAKNGLAISGHNALVCDYENSDNFKKQYFSTVKSKVEKVRLSENYKIPSELDNQPKLRSLYIELQCEAAAIIVGTLKEMKLFQKEQPNADNSYPAVLLPFILDRKTIIRKVIEKTNEHAKSRATEALELKKQEMIKKLIKKIGGLKKKDKDFQPKALELEKLKKQEIKDEEIEKEKKKFSLTEKEAKLQDVYVELMASIFVYYGKLLNLNTMHRSSFGHPTLTAAPCNTHMRISPGILLNVDDFQKIILAISMTCHMDEALRKDSEFITFMSLRESEKGKAKLAIYNIVMRNLQTAFYNKKVSKALFAKQWLESSNKINKENIKKVIVWLNNKIAKEKIAVKQQQINIPKGYQEKSFLFSKMYCQKLGLSKNQLNNSDIQNINQYRMLEFAQKQRSSGQYKNEVSSSDGQTQFDKHTVFHKKSGALNGMHAVHKIMDAICDRDEKRDLFINYVAEKMYFETGEVLKEWIKIFKERKGIKISRRTDNHENPRSGEKELKILFIDLNHCNVSYDEREKGSIYPNDFYINVEEKTPFDYYVLDITSSLPETVKFYIELIYKEINSEAIIFTLSSLLKYNQVGADFFSQGQIRIFAKRQETVKYYYNIMKKDIHNVYLGDQACRRFMKKIGAALQVSDIFPKDSRGSNQKLPPLPPHLSIPASALNSYQRQYDMQFRRSQQTLPPPKKVK